MNTKNIGNVGEDIAVEYLKSNGYKIVKRNFFALKDEIDIIALKDNVLVFVEVKTRSNYSFGNPLESITYTKQQNLIKCARCYIAQHNLYENQARFDVIVVANGKVEHFEDAFWVN